MDSLVDRMTRETERQIVKNYRRSLVNIRVDLQKLYDKYGTEGKLTYAEMTRYNRLANLHKTLEKELIDLTGSNGRETKMLAGNAYQESFYRYGYLIEKNLRVGLRYGILNREVIRAAVQNPIGGLTLNEVLEKNRRDIILKVRQEVTQGLVKGESYFKMAGRIKETLGKDAPKALRVARTEGGRAQSLGMTDSLDHAEGRGIQMDRIWVATLDGRTRDSHQSMDGQKADENGYFTLPNGAKTRGPLQSGLASEDINCRCTVITDVDEDTVRRVRGEGVQKYKTYEEWRRNKDIRQRRVA